MNISRKPAFLSFSLLLIMFLPLMAQGACETSDLAGTWTTFAISVDSIGSYPSATTSCTLRLKSTGKINTDRSKCYERDYQGLVKVAVAGGSFYVKDSCHLGGKLKMDTTFGRQTFEVDFGTLAKTKKTFSAVGYIVEAPSIVTHVTGVKR